MNDAVQIGDAKADGLAQLGALLRDKRLNKPWQSRFAWPLYFAYESEVAWGIRVRFHKNGTILEEVPLPQ